MKLAIPLGLQVSLWLLLNILLLAGLGVAYFLLQGGHGWDALVAGPAGRNLPALARAAAAEVAAAAAERRDGVLDAAGNGFGVTFTLLEDNGEAIAGPVRSIPRSVWARVDPPPRPDDFDPRPPPPRPRPAPPPRDPGEQDPPAEPGRRRGQFLVHDAHAFWLGFRVPFPDPDLKEPVPSILLIRAGSLWRLLGLLDIVPWLYGGSAVLVISILFWSPFIYRQTRALRRLTLATGRIADGQLETRVARGAPDEFGRLGEAINTMAERLKVLMKGQKRFLGDMAHELCSPLARLEVATGILEAQAEPAMRPALADVREEVEEMSALVNELLAFSRAGLRPRDVPLEALPLEPLIRAVLAREDTAGEFAVEFAPGLVVAGDEALLKRALANLLRNALRHGAAPRRCTATWSGDGICVTVSDAGHGVAEHVLARLGEPFFRPDDSRTRDTGGAGLGLAIVKAAVTACGGQVTFRANFPQGFIAEVQLRAATLGGGGPA